jgi:hypothetical protein
MQFDRYTIRPTLRPITGRRLAAAKRALQRQADEVALFPELQPTETAESRCRRFDEAMAETVRDWRATRAAKWRRARKLYRSLDDSLRAEVDARFFDNRFMPKDPVYLLDIIHGMMRKEAGL